MHGFIPSPPRHAPPPVARPPVAGRMQAMQSDDDSVSDDDSDDPDAGGDADEEVKLAVEPRHEQPIQPKRKRAAPSRGLDCQAS